MTERMPHDLDPRGLARIHENLARVRSEVEDACRAAGRCAADVRIVGVTKYVDAAATVALAEAGLGDLGESRPQSLWEKADAFRQRGLPVRWHLVGHLQRNKVRRTLPEVQLIHSLDSLRLIGAVRDEATAGGMVVEALLEVNLAGAAGRTGFRPEELPAALDAAGPARSLRIRGLMGMASAPVEGREPAATARAEFAHLREMAERLRASHPAAASLTELSMGMSGDFREAILEGSTLVRIGSSLWEGVGGA